MKNPNTEIKWQATLIDWSIVLYPDIYKATETPLTVFAKLNCGRPVALFGREMNDPRYNAEKGDAFADGHRLVTSPIIAVKNGEYHTADTIYTLDEAAKNTDFKEWCEKNQYKEVPLDGVWEKTKNKGVWFFDTFARTAARSKYSVRRKAIHRAGTILQRWCF